MDVGANIGWYTAYSAAAGCRVIGVEPQPRLLSVIHYTLDINEFSSKIENPKCMFQPVHYLLTKRSVSKVFYHTRPNYFAQ